MRTILLLLALLPTLGLVQAQSGFAKFYADMGRIDRQIPEESDDHAEWMEMTWRIHGQTLHWGGDTVAIAVDHKIDTLFFRLREGRAWDTLICNISQPRTYVFEYNTCCNYFDVHDVLRKRDRIQGLVSFQMQNGKKGIRYLGNMDDAGGLIDGKAPIVVTPYYCRSVMFPNNYKVVVSEVVDCTDSAACNATVCLFKPGESEPHYDFALETTRVLSQFRYLPLSPEPLQVIWDAKQERLQIKGPFPGKTKGH